MMKGWILFMRRNIVIPIIAVCMFSIFTGCGFVSNPMRYMMQADSSELSNDNQEDTTDSSQSDDSETYKVAVIGTNEDISDKIDAGDYADKAAITFIQQTSDFADTSDMLALVKKVTEVYYSNVNAIIVSAKSSVANEVKYLLDCTISCEKPIIVMTEDESGKDFKDIFEENFEEAVSPHIIFNVYTLEDVPLYASNSGKIYNDIINISNEKYLPSVNIIYDYIGNDAYSAEKVIDVSEGVVIVTDTADGSLSPAMTQLIKDRAGTPIVIVSTNNALYDYESDGLNVITTKKLTAQEARIKLMTCLTKTQDIEQISTHFSDLPTV